MNHTLIAAFDTPASAVQARQGLLDAGFADTDIRVLSQDEAQAAASMPATGSHHEGGIKGFFNSLFGTDETHEDVGLYAEAVRRGGVVLSVNAADDAQMQRAEDILQRFGAVDIDERATQWRQEGWMGDTTAPGAATLGATDTASSRAATAAGASATDTRATIPVVQEELQVGKRAVRRGGLRVFSRVVETPVQETVNLREEHATIQRRAVDRPATEADLAAAVQSGTIEVRETVEEPVVAKSARVVEEIEVGKQVTERAETVRDTVRHTDVQVERLEGEHAMARPEATDATRTTSTSDRPGSRLSDTIERAIPGDSDRDGK